MRLLILKFCHFFRCDNARVRIYKKTVNLLMCAWRGTRVWGSSPGEMWAEYVRIVLFWTILTKKCTL